VNLDDRKHRRASSPRPRKHGSTQRASRPWVESLEARALLATRLFALPVTDTSSIVELNPSTGAEINQFTAPVPAASDGENGLAFDGQTLYYMPGDGTDRLWELNPDTGAVLKSAVITAGSGHFDGLGAVDGKLYLQDDVNHDLVIVDPASETVIGQLNVQATLIGGLTGADNPSELIATENFNTAVFIDPDTGAVLGRSSLPGPVEGVAFVDGDLYFGSSQSDQIYITDRSGNLLATLNTAFPVSGLGGDGEVPTPTPTPTPTEQVVNGDFELGTLQGWTAYDEPDSIGPGFQVYQGAEPFGSSLPAPPQGAFAAANDQTGPGTDILYQDVTIPAGSTASLSMLLAYSNQAAGFVTPGTLDYQAGPDQQIRVDIISPDADLLSTSPNDVLLNVFQTQAGAPNTLAPTELDADLSAFAGKTVRLRIAVVDNQSFLNATVDAISIQTQPTPTPTPTPSSYYVADPASPGGGAGEILRVDPTTGAQTVVSSGGQFVDPYSVAVAPDGSLIVADPGTYGGTGTIFRVDPTTGAQSVIATGGYLVDPGIVTFAPNRQLLIGDFGGGGEAMIIEVNPTTGQQSIVSEGGYLMGPFGMATSPDGTIYVADFGQPGTTTSSGLVFSVDPSTGQQTIVSAGGQFVTPVGILVALDGSLIVSDDHAIDQRGAIFRVDPQTGAQTVISQDGSFEQPIGLAFAPDGSLLVVDAHAAGGDGALIRVDLTTGAQTIISSGGDFLNPLGVAVSIVSTPPVVTPPTADAGGPYTVEEGGTVTLDASGTTDPSQDPSTLTYLWDLNGDGIFGETGSAATNGDEVGLHPSLSAAGLPGSTWTVSLEVIDSQGNVSTSTGTIYIENLPPTVDLAPSATVGAGSALSLQGSFTDPETGGTFTGGVDYGDGAGDQWLPLNPDQTFDLSHVYEHAGTYTVTVYVADNNDGLGQATLEVTVNPIAPAFDSLAGASITYGQGDVTLGGHISGAALVPSGSVSISLDGVTQMAAIDPTTGDFSSDFSTATLGVQGSPYAVTYSYLGDGTYTPISDSTQTVTVSPRALTITANDDTKVYGQTITFAGTEFSTSGLLNGDQVTAATLASSGSPAAAPVGTDLITASAAAGTGLDNYSISYVPGTMTVTLSPSGTASIYVLDAKAAGAFNLSGNGNVAISANLVVDSSSPSAAVISGNGKVAAAQVLVTGGISNSGNAHLVKTGTPGATGDPLAELPVPTGSGPVISEVLSGNSTATIGPGVYSQITVSGNARLNMTGGVYIVEGGGVTVSGNASITGSAITIYNTGNAGGTYGSITVSGDGTVALAAPTSGPYAGILIFQDRKDSRALSLSGSATLTLGGTIYAPAAQLAESGNAQIIASPASVSMVVDSVAISGNGVIKSLSSSNSNSIVAAQAAAGGISELASVGDDGAFAPLPVYDDPSIYFVVATLDMMPTMQKK
jgi:hypothetical protein